MPSRRLRRFRAFALALATSALVPATARAQRGGGPPAATRPGPLRFEFLGPSDGGRFASVVGIPGAPGTYYAGAASGGIWKSTDAGAEWAPIFDDQDVAAIGTLAVAPSNPDVVWAGTGEAWAIRDADVTGDGVYKSMDAGATWRNMGLPGSGRVGRIVIHPTDPNTVYVCALGRTTAPQEDKGVYKTTDGGATWQRVLFVDVNTGCSGLAMDPTDPNKLIAGMWQVEMHTWAMFGGGPSSGVWMTRDGGRRWSRLTKGLPKSPVGKIDVAFAPSDAQRVYALIQTVDQGSVWRSEDGGGNWNVVSWDRTLIGRAGYYIRLLVSPTTPDEILVATSSMHVSRDGGKTFTTISGCGDCHDIWWDPQNADHFVLTGDGGLSITLDHGRTRTNVSLPIGQMYHVAVDDRIPYWVYSNRQDDGTMRGPGNSPELPDNVPSYLPQRSQGGRGGRGGGGGFGGGRGGGASWDHGIGGCESGFTIPDPGNPDVVWATCYGNKVTRYDAKTGLARSVQPWMQTLDSPPEDTKYRCHWTPPLALDPFEPETVYYGCQVIFKTSNGGQSWSVISPDLSTQDSSRIISSGGIIGDNLGQFYGEVVFAIAPSEIQRGLIWAGTNDGKVWYTRDGGTNWTDVTKNITGMPVWGTIRQITPSTFDARTAYVAVDLHLMDDGRPYIYKTTDLGQTWTRVNGDLPSDHPLDYVMTVAENPNRRGMLFAGTGHAFYYSMDDGTHWTQLQDGLPPAPVSWIVPVKNYHDVVVSTYGRGIWVLRDIARLEQSDRIANAQVYLYEPRSGFRMARSGNAEFLFQMRSPPSDSVRFEILDGSNVIRTFKVAAEAGLTRAMWDLRYESPTQVELRTLAPDNPHIWDEPRFQGRDTRPVTHWGIQGAQRAGPLAAPGAYTVRMTVDGQPYTRSFTVIKDPEIEASEADLVASTRAQIEIRDDLNATADMTNRIEIMRKQIEDLLASNRNGGIQRSLRELDQKMLAVELQLLSRSDLESDDKWFVEAYKVYLNLIWLNGEVGTGASDVAGGADYRPTDQSMAVLQQIEQDLTKAKADFDTLMTRTVPEFNRSMNGRLPPISDKLPPKTTT